MNSTSNRLYSIHESSPLKFNAQTTDATTFALESGQIIFLPASYIQSNDAEINLLSLPILDRHAKNIGYHPETQRLSGYAQSTGPKDLTTLKTWMHKYALFAREWVEAICPHYTKHLQWGRTSYRPAEVQGRKTSKRKDDTRLHVDAFVATPVNGLRILRVFCNINPHQQPRVWHVGEKIPEVIHKFSHKLPSYQPFTAKILNLIKVTKTLRSAYDHYMLQLHDQMKLDDSYQQQVTKERIEFQPQTTWMVFTDQVSHAALSGQFLLEQTFYLPVGAMQNPEYSPLMELKKHKGELHV